MKTFRIAGVKGRVTITNHDTGKKKRKKCHISAVDGNKCQAKQATQTQCPQRSGKEPIRCQRSGKQHV